MELLHDEPAAKVWDMTNGGDGGGDDGHIVLVDEHSCNTVIRLEILFLIACGGGGV